MAPNIGDIKAPERPIRGARRARGAKDAVVARTRVRRACEHPRDPDTRRVARHSVGAFFQAVRVGINGRIRTTVVERFRACVLYLRAIENCLVRESRNMAASSSSAYDLSSSPSHLLHRAQQYAADRFAAAFNGEDITQRQFAVLNGVAAQQGLTQTDLVKLTGIDRSTLAELVARMSTKGYLKRSRAKSDARANTLNLTAKGRSLLTKALPKVRKADQAILDTLAKTKQSTFLAMLKSIDESLDAQEEAAAAPKPPTRKAPARKAATRKAPARKAATRKAATRKAPARKTARGGKSAPTRRRSTTRRSR